MIADLFGVAGEGGVADGVVVSFESVEVGIHGGLGVDDDLLAGGKFDDEVGAEAAAFGVGSGGLGDEVAILDHAGHFDDAAELHFAPLAAADRLAEGFDELSGFLLEPALGLDHVADLLVEGGVGAFAGFLELTDAALDLFEGVGDRFDHAFDGLAAFLDLAFGFLLLGTEGGAGEREELFLGGAKGVCGEGFEGLAEADFGGFEEGLFLGVGLPLGLEAGFQLTLALEEGEFGVAEFVDFGFLTGGDRFRICGRLLGSTLAFLGAGLFSLDLAAHEEPGEHDSEEEPGEGGDVSGVCGEKFHGEIVPCGLR